MTSPSMQLEPAIEALYVRALLAIARTDRDIDPAESERLDAVIRRRCPTVSVGELWFERVVTPEEVIQGLRPDSAEGPYRTMAIDPRELGRMFVADALAIIEASGGMSWLEERLLRRFAPLFGMPDAELREALAAVDFVRPG